MSLTLSYTIVLSCETLDSGTWFSMGEMFAKLLIFDNGYCAPINLPSLNGTCLKKFAE